MTKGWGRGIAGSLLVTGAVAVLAGCGGAADAEAKPKKAPAVTKTAKPVKAQWDDTMEWWASHDIGCLNGSRVEADEEGCAIRVQDYVADVRKIRKAMNSDAAAPKGFYTDAYVIIDRLEKYAGVPAGKGDTQGWLDARPLIWMEGQALTRWVQAHPLQ
ncbi:hypothetical protein [Streptomyces chrestomyceticus]|uniref:hypothetical protein n=1 Tax=Streptomyces chrestomyceticus TaxID=68185 RepID=UPI0033F3DD13